MESSSDRTPVSLWAAVALAIILSVTAIVLHMIYVTDRRGNLEDRSSAEYQQLMSMNQQLRSEITRIQEAISEAPNYSKLRQNFRQNNASVAAAPMMATRADSPLAALMILEQSQLRSSFDDYQKIHPAEQQKVLEQIFQVNREIKLAYEELSASLSTRFSDLPMALEEYDTDRLRRVLFGKSKSYQVTETKYVKDTQAEMNVTVTIDEGMETASGNPKSTTLPTKLAAYSDGVQWKICDYPEAIKRHTQVLTKLKQRLKDCQAVNERCKKNEFRSYADFLKAWESLPPDE